MPKVVSLSWSEHWLHKQLPGEWSQDSITTLREAKERLNDADIVMFMGGGDIPPSFYGQKVATNGGFYGTPSVRDKNEYEIMNYCIEKGIRMLGLCRGAQLLCAGAGGELVQDVGGHHGYHAIRTKDGSELQVNSTHHQMMRPRGIAHELIAWSPHQSHKYIVDTTSTTPVDRTIDFPLGEPEAVYFPVIRALAIQWHPEQNSGAPYSKYAVKLVQQYLLEMSNVE